MWNKKIIEPRYAFVLLEVMVGFSGIGLSREEKNKPISVVQCPNQTTSLEGRWQWAMEQMARQPVTKHIWIGFSIERLMSEHSFIGRWPVDPDYPTLSERIYDIRVELPERSYSRYRVHHKVIKEVAYLFEMNRTTKSIGQIQTSNISLTVYMNRGVLFWLGKVGHAQAFSLLRKLYDDTNDDYLKKRLMGRITDFDHPQVVSFLDDVLRNEKSERVRKEAVEELDHYQSQGSLDILLRTVRNDPSVAVKKEAIDNLSHIESSAAEDALIEIAKTGSPPIVRREAIDKLRDIASDKVINCMVSIINQDANVEIQQEALESLTRIENDKALDALIRICQTHNRPRIRREGIKELRDIDELRLSAFPKAIDCLAFVVNKKDELQENQLEALDALADIENNKATDVLIQVAGNHVNPRIREEAIDHLSDMDELRLSNSVNTIKCFESIIDNQEELEKIQRRALDALKDIEHQDVRTYITKIARSHPKQKIRKEAQEIVAEWIRDS